MNYRRGSSGTRHGRSAGCGASGDGGRSRQKAVLRSPSTFSGKEVPGLAVSVLALVSVLLCQARSSAGTRAKARSGVGDGSGDGDREPLWWSRHEGSVRH